MNSWIAEGWRPVIFRGAQQLQMPIYMWWLPWFIPLLTPPSKALKRGSILVLCWNMMTYDLIHLISAIISYLPSSFTYFYFSSSLPVCNYIIADTWTLVHWCPRPSKYISVIQTLVCTRRLLCWHFAPHSTVRAQWRSSGGPKCNKGRRISFSRCLQFRPQGSSMTLTALL